MIEERKDNYQEEGNYYEADADYYYNSALKINTKDGKTQFI